MSKSQHIPVRAIILLAGAGFAAQALVRVTDSMLPEIAADFGTTAGEASIVVWVYVLSHGSIQLMIGPIADRFGKYRTVTLMCAVAAVLVALCGLMHSLSTLALARFASGAAIGWIVPISIAYIGDVTPYEGRQPILGRYLSGQICGQLFGQAAGGVLGDLLGWRNVFFLLGGMFALVAAALLVELLTNPRTRTPADAAVGAGGFVADYKAVLSNPWARLVIFAVFIESIAAWGSFSYIGAHLRVQFDLSFTAIGLIVATFGLGGLIYAATVQQLVKMLGRPALATFGGIMLGLGFLTLARSTTIWLAPPAVIAIGLGFYALHNTIQTSATQMTPEARGTSLAIFSSAIYLGQVLGVLAGSTLFDQFTANPLFFASAVTLPLLGWWFGRKTGREQEAKEG